MKSQRERKPAPAKLMAAVLGGTAVVAMGALTLAVSETTAGPGMLTSSESTLGETSTETTAPSTLATSFATPAITSAEDAG